MQLIMITGYLLNTGTQKYCCAVKFGDYVCNRVGSDFGENLIRDLCMDGHYARSRYIDIGDF